MTVYVKDCQLNEATIILSKDELTQILQALQDVNYQFDLLKIDVRSLAHDVTEMKLSIRQLMVN